ncbi:MAG: hypothetical protein LUI60_03690 [Clostridia bacterium]|nr:hypothetical protein [Clostridia bacterium]
MAGGVKVEGDARAHNSAVDIADCIAEDVISFMNKDLSCDPEWANPLKIHLSNGIYEALMKNGFEEKFNNALDNAFYREDVYNEINYFCDGNNKLPSVVDPKVISDALSELTSEKHLYDFSIEYINALHERDHRVNALRKQKHHSKESNVSDDEWAIADHFKEWMDRHDNYVETVVARAEKYSVVDEDERDQNRIKDAVMGFYTTDTPKYPARDSYGIDKAGQSIFTFGDPKRSPDHDQTVSFLGKKERVESFDRFVKYALYNDSGIKNRDVRSEYSHFINLFVVDGKRVDYHGTGNPDADKRRLEEIKNSIMLKVELGENVEFIKPTLDSTGKCTITSIPVVHASYAAEGKVPPHVYSDEDIKAIKLAQKITDKVRKETEREHKAYLANVKKAENELRKENIAKYKDDIKNAEDKQTKDSLKKELKDLQKYYKELDKERKARQKKADAIHKNRLKEQKKLEKRQQKEQIAKIKTLIQQQRDGVLNVGSAAVNTTPRPAESSVSINDNAQLREAVYSGLNRDRNTGTTPVPRQNTPQARTAENAPQEETTTNTPQDRTL